MRGRTSKYTKALGDEIAGRLSKGEPLAVICRDEGMPDPATVWRWTRVNEAFAQDIVHAREAGFDVIAAECLAIAEDGSRDYKIKLRQDGIEYGEFDSEHVQRSKLRIETRLRLLAKWDPKRYGDKLQHTGGSEGDAPIALKVITRRVVYDALPPPDDEDE